MYFHFEKYLPSGMWYRIVWYELTYRRKCLNNRNRRVTQSSNKQAWGSMLFRNVGKLVADCVVYEVLTAMVIKSYVFWYKMQCSPLKVNRRFGGTCRLYFQDLRRSQVGNKVFLLHASFWFLLWLVLRSWSWRWHVPTKRLLSFNEVHSVHRRRWNCL
jgi:hypothetical protein